MKNFNWQRIVDLYQTSFNQSMHINHQLHEATITCKVLSVIAMLEKIVEYPSFSFIINQSYIVLFANVKLSDNARGYLYDYKNQ